MMSHAAKPNHQIPMKCRKPRKRAGDRIHSTGSKIVSPLAMYPELPVNRNNHSLM